MKLTLTLFFFLSVFICPASAAVREKTLGLGISFGDINGITLKTWRGEDSAIDASMGWDRRELRFSVNFLWHFFGIIHTGTTDHPLYYGLGTRVRIRNDNPDKSTVGLRFPGGVSYIFTDAPLEIFAEVGPVLDIVLETDMHFTGLTGIRYYF